MFFASNNADVALNVAWNGGSTTAFVDVNPNYSVYDVDLESYEVLDKHVWIYNLTEANIHGAEKEPRWFKEYSFSEEFGADLSPSSLYALTQRFQSDEGLLKKYRKFKVKQADSALKIDCGKGCMKHHLCDILTSDFHVREYCIPQAKKTGWYENITWF